MSRGVYHIKLIENKNVSITYVDEETVSVLTSANELDFTHCYEPTYEDEIEPGENKTDIHNRTIQLRLKELSELSNVEKILDNYYGWLAIVTDGEGNHYIILDPLFLDETEENYQQGVNYLISLSHQVDSDKGDFIFVEQMNGIGIWIIEDTFIVQ